MTVAASALAICLLVLELAVPRANAGDAGGAQSTVDCESRPQTIGRTPRSGPMDIIAGPLILRDAKARAREPRSEFEPRRPRATMPVKVPFIVAAGHPVTLSLSERAQHHAAIEAGLDQAPYRIRTASVRLVPCRPEATVADRPVGPRTAFLGGFRIDGPRCLRLSVLPDGAADPIRRRIAFGRGTCRSPGG